MNSMQRQSVQALAMLDHIMQGVKSGDQGAIEESRKMLIEMVGDSSPNQLYVLMVSVRVMFERAVDVTK